MGIETAVTAGSAVLGAGASLIGGSNASASAEKAQEKTQETTNMDKIALMLGFANAKQYQEEQVAKALAGIIQGRADLDTYGTRAIDALSGLDANFDNYLSRVRSDEANYMALGEQGLKGYSGLLSDPSSITSDPGYKFQLSQGINALDRSAASKGLLLSGSQQKALDQYGQDYASTSLDKILTRYLNAVNVGQAATTQVNNAGATAAQGKSAVGQAKANALLNLGSQYYNVGRDYGSLYTNLGDDIQRLWDTTSNNLIKLDTAQNETTTSTESAKASAENNALSGVANSLNSGVKNYLSTSGYGTNTNPFTNGTRNLTYWS